MIQVVMAKETDLCTFCDATCARGGAFVGTDSGGTDREIFACERCGGLLMAANEAFSPPTPKRSRSLAVIATIGISVLSALAMASAVANAGINLRIANSLESIAGHCGAK